MTKKVVVFGGSGFAGSHTADILSQKGYEVTIFDIHPSKWIRNDQTIMVNDLSDSKAIREAVKGAFAVYHYAGVADIRESSEKPFETFDSNIMGTVRILEECIKENVERFVYASTMYVYSEQGSYYKASKQASEVIIESYCKDNNMDFTFLRYGSLYGPRSQKWNGLNKLVRALVKDNKINYQGTGNELREYIHVIDASKLSVKILQPEYANKAVILTGSQEISSKQLLSMISEISGMNAHITFDDSAIDQNHYASTPYKYTPKRAIKLVPDEFIDLGQGILDLIEEIDS